MKAWAVRAIISQQSRREEPYPKETSSSRLSFLWRPAPSTPATFDFSSPRAQLKWGNTINLRWNVLECARVGHKSGHKLSSRENP